MEQVVRRYIARVLLLHLLFLAVVVGVVAIAGRSLYLSAQNEAKTAALERLALPANQVNDALETHLGSVFDALAFVNRTRVGRASLRQAAPGGTTNGPVNGAGSSPAEVRAGAWPSDTRSIQLGEALWNQLSRRLSDLLILDTSLNIRQHWANEAPAQLSTTGAGADSADADPAAEIEAINELIPLELRTPFASDDQAAQFIQETQAWLGTVIQAGEPALSGPVVIRSTGDDGKPIETPVLLAAMPWLGPQPGTTTGSQTERADANASRPVRGLLIGVIPVGHVENSFLTTAQDESLAMLLFDAQGHLIAGGGSSVVGTPVQNLAPDRLPPSLAQFILNNVRGESDPRREFDGPVRIGTIEFTSTLAAARPVRWSRSAATTSPDNADNGTPPDRPNGLAEVIVTQQGDVTESGETRADSLGTRNRLWLVVLLNREAVISQLERTTQTAILWGGGLMLALTAILVSSALQLIHGRGRLERLRSEMIDKELREARQIQLMWLPDDEIHETAGRNIGIAAENLPASHISGDFYNYFDLPDGRCALVIGDVTGHGMAAAFLMATTQLLIKTTLQRLRDPGKTLEEVNRLLCSQAFGGQFVTIQLVVIDPRSDDLQIASAGHPAPLTCTADGGWQPLQIEPQLVLGVMDDAEYPTETVHVDECDSMLLYTDGAVEAKNLDNERFSTEQLCQRLREEVGHQVESAKSLSDATLRIVREFAGGAPLEDDVTLLAVHLGPIRRRKASERPTVAHVS